MKRRAPLYTLSALVSAHLARMPSSRAAHPLSAGDQSIYNSALRRMPVDVLDWGVFDPRHVHYGCFQLPDMDRTQVLAAHAVQTGNTGVVQVRMKLGCIEAMHRWLQDEKLPDCRYAWHASPKWKLSHQCRAACEPQRLSTNCTCGHRYTVLMTLGAECKRVMSMHHLPSARLWWIMDNRTHGEMLPGGSAGVIHPDNARAHW